MLICATLNSIASLLKHLLIVRITVHQEDNSPELILLRVQQPIRYKGLMLFAGASCNKSRRQNLKKVLRLF